MPKTEEDDERDDGSGDGDGEGKKDSSPGGTGPAVCGFGLGGGELVSQELAKLVDEDGGSLVEGFVPRLLPKDAAVEVGVQRPEGCV